MQLASMVHGSGRDREAHDHRQLQHQHSNFYAQPQGRVYHPHADVTTALVSNPYANHQQVEYQYQRAPQSPPSPPVEEVSKPSLPSISSLLGIADGERGSSETGNFISFGLLFRER
jgi:hypothetical protein